MKLQLHGIDIGIVLLYLVGTMLIGFWISRRASQNMKAYFLGGNKIPWYFLGLSNASGMFDISGTMWMVYLLFVYGLKSVWIPWLWPVFNQVFLMIYLSVWLRRSNVMTGAEWIGFRFGKGRGADLAHIVVVVFALFNVIGFLAYGFIGIGKFSATFLPFEFHSDPGINADIYGIIITLITTLYVVKGGMYSVVFTEVLQFFIMTIACVGVGTIAMREVSPGFLGDFTPEGWGDIFFGWKLDLDWSGIMESANEKITEDGWSLFSIFFMLMLFKGYLQSAAGPAPNYDMQRILSARSPREAAKMSAFVNVVLLIPRYMLITGLTILALAFFMDDLKAMGAEVDFELILPFAIREFLPVGLMGILIAGLLAAFMSTYAATVNAAPAYIVNDIYKRFINAEASDKTYVRLSYISSACVVVVGTAFGFMAESLNGLIQWIVAALYGGYTAANLLKWYWWRFNSRGYFWGMVSGIGVAMFLSLPFDAIPETDFLFGWLGNLKPLEGFVLIFLVSLLVSVFVSLTSPPDDEGTLKNFYLKVRPWGFWRPIHEKVKVDHPTLSYNDNFGRDMINVGVGIIWQTALTASGIYLVLQDWLALALSLGLVILSSIFLKFSWYDHLEDWPQGMEEAISTGDSGLKE